MTKNKQVLFISHGGGPMPLLGDPSHIDLVNCLKNIVGKIKKPSAIIVISAHWEENIATITSNATPDLLYDYYGFPEESYQIKYPSVGEPLLAEQLSSLFEAAGVESKLDVKRGLDHGVFVPLKIMYPDADVPVVQLSLLNSLDPAEHIKMGQVISELEYENLLVLGSGFSFHNMKAFFAPETAKGKSNNESFEQWLLNTCSNEDINEVTRAKLLIEWEKAPAARYCQPREEHLLPLHVCYGVAGHASTQTFELKVLNKKSSMYLW
jgi:aromatic ring-opening dioxygenase catalytic subunit (LigB family)